MAEKENVVSMEGRRKTQGNKRRGGKAPESAGAKTGSAGDAGPVPGQLIWLFCPTCNSLEYTEVDMRGGRVHNTCGTQVHEVAVPLDLRAEMTLASVNLHRIHLLEQVLEGQRHRFEEYQQRLQLAAGRNLEPYPTSGPLPGSIDPNRLDAFGLLISGFFHDATNHFPETRAGGESPPGDPQDPDA